MKITKTVTLYQNNELVNDKTTGNSDTHSERELALELCLISHMFKNLEFVTRHGSAKGVTEETDEDKGRALQIM